MVKDPTDDFIGGIFLKTEAAGAERFPAVPAYVEKLEKFIAIFWWNSLFLWQVKRRNLHKVILSSTAHLNKG